MGFLSLHTPGDPFILVNVWDAGTARMAAGLGAKAIATSSAAQAFTLGRRDGQVTLDEAVEHAATLAAATSLPLSVDFEDGYAANAEEVAINVARIGSETGAAGLSIEDCKGARRYDTAEALDRMEAAVAAKGDLVLCARADGVMYGAYDVAEAVRRCAAFAEAGADVLYAPVLPDAGALQDIVSLGKPVNGLAAGAWLDWSLDDWASAGVARVSLGSTLARFTQRAMLDGMRATIAGQLPALRHTAVADEIDAMMEPRQ